MANSITGIDFSSHIPSYNTGTGFLPTAKGERRGFVLPFKKGFYLVNVMFFTLFFYYSSLLKYFIVL
jgi:hypothetical protein